MSVIDEVTELHRLSGRALVMSLGEGEGAEQWLAGACSLSLSGQTIADFNMLMLAPPLAQAEAFLVQAVTRADARGFDLLATMAPAVADDLAPTAERLGLSAAGTLPLMVLRGSDGVRTGRSCQIERVVDAQSARRVGDLVSAAFQLPRDAVAQVIEPAVGPTAAADIWLASDGGEPMSTVTVTRTGDTAGIWSMATPPQHQGKGMGRALLSRVIRQLGEQGVERFFLFATAAGFPLYASLGFVTLADEVAWVKGHSTQTHA